MKLLATTKYNPVLDVAKQKFKKGKLKRKLVKLGNDKYVNSFVAPQSSETSFKDLGILKFFRSRKSKTNNVLNVHGQGDVVLRNLDVHLDTENAGKLKVQNVLSADSLGANDVDIKDIKGHAAVFQATGNVKMKNVQDGACVSDVKGNVHMSGVKGDVLAIDNESDVLVEKSENAFLLNNKSNAIAMNNKSASVRDNKGAGVALNNGSQRVARNGTNISTMEAFKNWLKGQ